MRKLLLSILLVALVITAVGVFAQDDPRGTVIILRDGDILEGEFSDMITAQLYGFNASAGDVVTISMTQITETLDPFIVLLGSAGEVLAYDDDSSDAAMLAALIDGYEIPVDGSYYILATSFEYVDDILTDGEPLAEPQIYELALTGNTLPADAEEDVVTIFRGVIEVGQTIVQATTTVEPVYYFLVEATAGQVLDITVESDAFDTLLHIFSPEGLRLAVNDDANGINSAIMGLEILEDGPYMIFVSDVFFYDAAELGESYDRVGEFTLSVTAR